MELIDTNKHRDSLTALCRCLSISRHQYYYQRREKKCNLDVEQQIITIFNASYQAYGTRRLLIALHAKGIYLSRRRIAKIMRKLGLKSKYTKAKFCIYKEKYNESLVANELQREFTPGVKREILVSDVSYVRVNNQWNYLCIFVAIATREIVGYSVGKHKTAELVMQAISQIPMNLSHVELFHSDRGKEFDNQLLDECLSTFGITRSLSKKGCPYDNAVAEATFKSIKTECINGVKFNNLAQLRIYFTNYADWFNHQRIHSTLKYLSPVEFKKQPLFNL